MLVQAGAGEGSAIADADYEAQGARIVPDAAAVFGEAELVLKRQGAAARARSSCCARSTTLFTYLHLAPAPELTRGLCELGRDLHRLRDGRGRAAGACRCSRR